MSSPFTRRRALAATLSLAAAAALPLAATAQGSGRLTIVVPYPPGSAPDFLARLLGEHLAGPLGRNVIVDNRPGANAIIGSDHVSKAKPDGATLLLVDRMTVVANPLLFAKLPYDPQSLAIVGDVARLNLALSVRSDAPYKSWAEFIAYAKAAPGKVTVGSGGPGSVHHLSLELMQQATGAQFTHVPYRGIAPAVLDVLGNQLAAAISGPEVIQQHVQAGKLRVLAVGGEQRSELFPQAPTLLELGIASPVLLPTTFSLLAPPATPEATLAPINAALDEVLKRPVVTARLAEIGLLPSPSTPAQTRAALAALQPRIADIIRTANIQVN